MNHSPRQLERAFGKADWLSGAIAGTLAFIVYFFTVAPNVTLLDSGEFIVAAQHFGVPHPTGYPLWTFLVWVFQLLPLGNAAWEVNLFSGVCGAFAVGLTAMLIRSSALWMVPSDGSEERRLKSFATVSGISLAVTFALSFSMWSQAVIAEVYTLHALLVGLFFVSLYVWLRNPESERPIYWVFFTLALAFSNHHLCLALSPLPFLVAILIRRDLLPDLIMAGVFTATLAYFGFSLLADNPLVMQAAIRLVWLVLPTFGIFLAVRKFRVHFKLTFLLPVAVFLGMLPYAYLPLASATNPPMNWGYTRTTEGFFASFNRSQYQGPLTEQSLRVLGRVLGMGVDGVSSDASTIASETKNSTPFISATRWAQFFWEKLIISFSPLGVLLFFAALLPVLRQPLRQRVWYYTLLIGFSLAAFLQPTLDRARVDAAGWWLQMPYHTHTNLLFACICGLGAFFLLRWIALQAPRWTLFLIVAIVIIPIWPFAMNHDSASQRDRWFGWQFGHDMLSPLPENAVLFGGTDPGRFVPTYMIFGESSQSPDVKRDPSFDRRDLYIITQNALADPQYLSYIRDHYSEDRPVVTGWFENWLGRDTTYPSQPLVLPDQNEIASVIESKADVATTRKSQSGGIDDLVSETHGEVARRIFESNKRAHRFFVEESFPMPWSYDHAIPMGMVYEIAPDPIDEIPADAVIADMEFWKNYTRSLLGNPRFLSDLDARRSFSKLRQSSANIYAFRKMNAETKRAAGESIALWPGNLEAIQTLSRVLWAEGDVDDPVGLSETAFLQDPKNPEAAALYLLARERQESEPAIREAIEHYRASPASFPLYRDAALMLGQIGDVDRIRDLQSEAEAHLGDRDDFLSLSIDIAMQSDDEDVAAELARKRAGQTNDADLWLDVAAIEVRRGQTNDAIDAYQQAEQLNKPRAVERLTSDRFLAPLKSRMNDTNTLVAPEF